MFCINCGQKIIEGAKFCPNCGINLTAIQNHNQEHKSSEVVLEKNVSRDVKKKYTKEEIIEKIFYDIFGAGGGYGKQIQIGTEYINEDELEASMDAYKISDPQEKPLLIYEYPDKKYIEGFVITNKRLTWRYGSSEDMILLEEIKDIEIGTSGLATVMYAISLDNLRYPKIYLLSIENVQEFVMRFRKFINRLHEVLGIDVGQSKKNVDAELGKEIAKVIIHSCKANNIDSIYCEYGNPFISSSSRKYKNAKAYYNIPDNEEIFLIYDTTVFGNAKKGFALCTSGFYFCSKESGYFSWKQFAAVGIAKAGFGEIKVGSQRFEVTDKKKMLEILYDVQAYLNNRE